MSIFKNILFLHDYPSDVRTADAPARSYAHGYGNHVASAQAFAPLGHAHAVESSTVSAPRGATQFASDARPATACS